MVRVIDGKEYDYVVAQDGSGDFTTIQEAADAASIWPKPGPECRIYVKPGTYLEQNEFSKDAPSISLRGDE